METGDIWESNGTESHKLPHEDSQMKSFIEKYDRNQQQLQTLAARDDLLSGNFNNPASVLCTIFPVS